MDERNGARSGQPAEDVTVVPLERLEAEICQLAGHLWAAECRWLLMVGEFDRRGAWSSAGLHSCAHWLSWRCGIDLGAARERVRVARRLVEVPLITAAFSRGELSYAKARALTRVANDANEAELLEIGLRRPPRSWSASCARNESAGLSIDPGTCRSLGEGESFDLGMTVESVLYPELRRRAASWSYANLHEPLLGAIPEFRPVFDEHLEDFEEVLIGPLFDTFADFVVDARRASDTPLLNRCLEFLASADATGDEEIRGLVCSSFFEAAGAWDPAMSDFVASWPQALRLEVKRQEQEALAGAA